MRVSTAHPDLEEIAAWLEGRVDETTAERLVAHVARCEECAELVDDVMADEEEAALSLDGGSAEDEDDSAAELQRPEFVTPPPSGESSPPRRFRPYLTVALAACAAVVAFRLYAPWDRAEIRSLAAQIADERKVRGETALSPACLEYLRRAGAYTDTTTLTTCLDAAKTDADLRYRFVKSERFAAWFEVEALRPGLCSALAGHHGSAAAIPTPYTLPCAPLLQSTSNDATSGS